MSKKQEFDFVCGYLRYALENINSIKFSIKKPYLNFMVYCLQYYPYFQDLRIFASFRSLGFRMENRGTLNSQKSP